MQSELGTASWVWCVLLAPFACSGLACLCIDSCRDKIHFCFRCGHVVGKKFAKVCWVLPVIYIFGIIKYKNHLGLEKESSHSLPVQTHFGILFIVPGSFATPTSQSDGLYFWSHDWSVGFFVVYSSVCEGVARVHVLLCHVGIIIVACFAEQVSPVCHRRASAAIAVSVWKVDVSWGMGVGLQVSSRSMLLAKLQGSCMLEGVVRRLVSLSLVRTLMQIVLVCTFAPRAHVQRRLHFSAAVVSGWLDMNLMRIVVLAASQVTPSAVFGRVSTVLPNRVANRILVGAGHWVPLDRNILAAIPNSGFRRSNLLVVGWDAICCMDMQFGLVSWRYRIFGSIGVLWENMLVGGCWSRRRNLNELPTILHLLLAFSFVVTEIWELNRLRCGELPVFWGSCESEESANNAFEGIEILAFETGTALAEWFWVRRVFLQDF